MTLGATTLVLDLFPIATQLIEFRSSSVCPTDDTRRKAWFLQAGSWGKWQSSVEMRTMILCQRPTGTWCWVSKGQEVQERNLKGTLTWINWLVSEEAWNRSHDSGIGGEQSVFFFLFGLFRSEIRVQSSLYANGLAGSLTCRLTGVMRSPPARITRSPYYRSAGHRLFSLRMTLSRGKGWSNGFEWDSSFVRCLMFLSWMTSCMAGIPRSLRIKSGIGGKVFSEYFILPISVPFYHSSVLVHSFM